MQRHPLHCRRRCWWRAACRRPWCLEKPTTSAAAAAAARAVRRIRCRFDASAMSVVSMISAVLPLVQRSARQRRPAKCWSGVPCPRRIFLGSRRKSARGVAARPAPNNPRRVVCACDPPDQQMAHRMLLRGLRNPKGFSGPLDHHLGPGPCIIFEFKLFVFCFILNPLHDTCKKSSHWHQFLGQRPLTYRKIKKALQEVEDRGVSARGSSPTDGTNGLTDHTGTTENGISIDLR